MLLLRSNHTIKLLGLFVLLINSALTQQYDGEYEGDDDHSSYNEESDGPDYSKYYSVDAAPSSPLINVKSDTTGFVNPAEFSSFFSPSFYAASNKQEVTKDAVGGFVKPQEFEVGFTDFKTAPFVGKDFFEEAAQSQKQNNKAVEQEENEKYELKPGPSYVSHKVVPPNAKKSNYESELDDLNKPYNYKNLDNQEEIVIPLYSEQQRLDPKYQPQYTPKKPNNLTPYQKYSFQGPSATVQSASTGSIRHTLSPGIANAANYDYLYTPTNQDFKYAYDVASSNANSQFQDFKEFKPSKLIKECKKINKHVPGTSKNSKPMDCYVCKDAKGANYEECSYGSESNPKNYYIETSKQYTEPTQVKNYNYNRYKRYTVNDNTKDDPYEYLKKQSAKYYDNPDFESSYKQPKSFEDDYRFGAGDFQNGEEKSSSEQVAAELLKSGENCRKVDKDGMTCMVCENKKTGGNYEQCSYTNAPKEKKYAYVKERKYNSEDDDPSEETESSEEKPVSSKKPQQFYKQKQEQESDEKPHYNQKNQKRRERGRKSNANLERAASEEESEEVERIKPVNTHRKASEYTIPKHFENIQVEPEKTQSEEDEEPDHDSYYYKHFPSESKREEQRQSADQSEQTEEAEAPEEHYGYYGEESKKDVEEVLAEFAKKDRSKCKKAEKNGMTCYLCVDKKGLQHEECMYVSESRPQSKYQAYHAQQETDGREGAAAAADGNGENVEESKVKSVRSSRSEPQKSETKYPHSDVSGKDNTSEAPKKIKRRRPTKTSSDKNATGKVKKTRKNNTKTSDKIDAQIADEPTVGETNDQYRVEGEKGAFSHETEPVYSKKYGITLPKFMLAKSEGELVYDEFAKSKS